MRRHSPARSVRDPGPRRRGRGRSLSPLSRSQPAPPGEERGRKSAWDAQTNRNKRFRSRSRPREWLREPFDRDPTFIRIVDNERAKGREQPMDKISKDRKPVKSREGNRERDRPMHLLRNEELKDVKHKQQHRRQSPGRILGQPDEYEESYLDHQPNHYGNNSGIHKNNDNKLLDTPSISFNTFMPERNSQEKPRDMPRNLHHPSPRDRHHPPPRESSVHVRESAHHGKQESASDRINRLEKLVEKLVESNVSPGKSKTFGFQPPKDIIPELIPNNSKFTTSMWINCIHEECLNKNYDEKSSIRFMQDKMTGIMKAWFKSVASYDFTWPELKLLITKTFPDNVEFAQTLKLLVLRDKNADETITQYFFSKLYLCEACKISGENAVSCLIDGLGNPFIKQDLKTFNFLTPEALYAEYLSKFPENEVPVRMDRREVREIIPEYSHEQFIPLEMDNRERDHQVDEILPYRLGERHDDRGPRGHSERQKCFTCKKFGHTTVECRHAPICYNCKKKGHIAAKCHFTNTLLISSATSSYTIPKIKCSINGQEYYGVIDTGSVAVTLKEQVAKNLGLKVGATVKILKGYGGTLVEPLGETEILLTMGTAKHWVKALIVEDKVQHVPVIVGQAFLCQDGVTLCQKDGQVSIFESSI